jgi:hypothetical protein
MEYVRDMWKNALSLPRITVEFSVFCFTLNILLRWCKYYIQTICIRIHIGIKFYSVKLFPDLETN